MRYRIELSLMQKDNVLLIWLQGLLCLIYPLITLILLKDNELLKKGFIQEDLSPWIVLALLTAKKNRSWRMRMYSHATITRTTIFVKIDPSSGYHKIPIRLESQWKTTLKMKDKLWVVSSAFWPWQKHQTLSCTQWRYAILLLLVSYCILW